MVEKTLNYILGHATFKTLSASRTDAMVSAGSSAFELFMREPIDQANLLSELNVNLPPDIRALEIHEVNKDFNIIQHAKEKEYLYLFSFGQKKHPFCAPFMTNVAGTLNVELMAEGAGLFEGSHNFRQYCYKPRELTQFVREVLVSEIKENTIHTASFFPEQSYVYRVRGKGFMRHQVRLMVGALFQLGKGSIGLKDIEASLQAKENNIQTDIAPSSGLMLNSVEFGQ